MNLAGSTAEEGAPRQLPLTWEVTPVRPDALPSLPALDREERLALDYELLGLLARAHPMRLLRRDLQRQGVRAIAELATCAEGRVVRVAGWPISAQRPPTAKSMGFLVLEDETGRLPVALPPRVTKQMQRVIRGARVVAVAGRLERVRWYHRCSAVTYAPSASFGRARRTKLDAITEELRRPSSRGTPGATLVRSVLGLAWFLSLLRPLALGVRVMHAIYNDSEVAAIEETPPHVMAVARELRPLRAGGGVLLNHLESQIRADRHRQVLLGRH